MFILINFALFNVNECIGEITDKTKEGYCKVWQMQSCKADPWRWPYRDLHDHKPSEHHFE